MPAVIYFLCGLVFRVPGYRSRGPGFDSQRYQTFWEVVGLERGSLSLVRSTIDQRWSRCWGRWRPSPTIYIHTYSLVRITEELLVWWSSGSGLENRECGRGDPLLWPRDTLYPQNLALTSPTSGGRSVGIVLLRTKATEFVLWVCEVGTCFVSHTIKRWEKRKHLHCVEKYEYIVCKDIYTTEKCMVLLSFLVLRWIFATFKNFSNKNWRY
jgi:hypothetical protein